MPARHSRLVHADVDDRLHRSLRGVREELDLPTGFPEEVLAEADTVAREVSVDPSVAGVADLRDLDFITIDPPGSTDLDQAIHMRRTPEGIALDYAIADLPAFVRPGGAIDNEARRRGQTLYAPDGRVPLHPERLSEDAASLLPDRDRRALVWRFLLAEDDATVLSSDLVPAVIRSRAQWTYSDAQTAIEDGSAPESLALLHWFGPARIALEAARGGASLGLPEVDIVRDGAGYHLELRSVAEVETWNAQVSLLAGMTAADMMLAGKVGVLRTMPPPAPDDVEAFRRQTILLGHAWEQDISYGEYLRRLPLDGAQPLAIREAAATLFRGAGYAPFDGAPPEDTVQAAIGAPYAHTTAPLRRLVDRWSLVVCRALAAGEDVPPWARESLAELPSLMSASGQLASRLTSMSLDRVEAAVLSTREGDVFEGTVIAERKDGVRVQLDEPPVVADAKGLTARPGERVHLRVVRADIDTGEVDLGSAP